MPPQEVVQLLSIAFAGVYEHESLSLQEVVQLLTCVFSTVCDRRNFGLL